MGESSQGNMELDQQAFAASAAFDKIDEDGHGYIMIDELHGLAGSLGLPIAPEEEDEALEMLDEDGDGVLDREAWTKWWVKRWQASLGANNSPDGGGQEGGRAASEGHSSSGEGRGEGGGGGGTGDSEKISRLAERARQARRRAGTDIHTAAWRGDLALVKDFLDVDPELANAVDVSEFGTGYRPLHYSSYGGFLDVCKALHAAGARALAAGDNGVTALFLAAQAGKADVVQFLLDLGADPTERERESKLCAADVVDDSNPEILRQMQEKCDLQPPPPLEVPPMVTKIGVTWLQVAFVPLPEDSGKLPVTRYKVKVEQDGGAAAAAASRSDQAAAAETAGTRIAATTASDATGKDDTPRKADVADMAIEPPVAAAASAPARAATSGNITGSGGGFAIPTIAQVVLIPARQVSAPAATSSVAASAADVGQQHKQQQQRPRRTFATARGLKPSTRYRIKVAAVNAIGFGPYGPASAAAVTLDEDAAKGDGGTKAGDAPPSSTAARSPDAESNKKKGKGRQVLAMERRRCLAAEATRLQEQQRREAEERQARRAQKLGQTGDARASERHLPATTAGAAVHHIGAGRTPKKGSSHAVATSQTQPLPCLSSGQREPRQRRRQYPSADADGAGLCGEDHLTESTDSARYRPRCHKNNDHDKVIMRTAERSAAHYPADANARASQGRRPAAHEVSGKHRRQHKPHGTRGSRPATTGGADGRGNHAGDDDDDDGSPSGSRSRPARLLATAPASTSAGSSSAASPAAPAGAVEERRYSAAITAGEMMRARAHPHRSRDGSYGSSLSIINTRPLRGSPAMLAADRRHAATMRPSRPASKGAAPGRPRRSTGQPQQGQGQGQGRRPREWRDEGRWSSSDVSISSCGDMTISSEEQEGAEMEYTG